MVVGSVVGAVTGFRVTGGSVVTVVVGSASAAPPGTATNTHRTRMIRNAQGFIKNISPVQIHQEMTLYM
jgi:hypothetical protein